MDNLQAFIDGMAADLALIERNSRDMSLGDYRGRTHQLRLLIDRGERVLRGEVQPKLRRTG
jgi:hypothetical protein